MYFGGKRKNISPEFVASTICCITASKSSSSFNIDMYKEFLYWLNLKKSPLNMTERFPNNSL